MSTLLARITGVDRSEEIGTGTTISEAMLIERLRDHFAAQDEIVEEVDDGYDDVEVRLNTFVAAMNEALRTVQLRVDMIEAKAELAERRFSEVEAKLRQTTARWEAADQRAMKAERFLARFHALIGEMLPTSLRREGDDVGTDAIDRGQSASTSPRRAPSAR